ncbi:hypothetical protein, partial [Streptococcus pseudopneumoniae]|uniref:hypothetical protein n=1 Tax=Streptococcus pseudopneumoniae TaxID=257758 RepID=UPI0018B08166
MGWLENTFGTVGPSAGAGATLTPEQQSAQWERARNTPMGQAAQRATDATNKLNRDKELASMQAKRDEIAVSQG